MANTTGDGGSSNTSGTAASVCAISPSDTVGVLNNFLTRIEKLEEIMMQIASANVLAGQISEISQQIGWMYGIEYLGQPGWAQTSYGTLVPPPGFTLLGAGLTLSDGNTYQAVYYDENGVLQFGFTSPESAGGTSIVGAAVAGVNVATLYTNTPIVNAAVINTNATATINIGSDPQNMISLPSSTSFQVAQSGWYLLTATCSINAFGDASHDGLGFLSWTISGNPSPYGYYWAVGPNIYRQSFLTSNTATLTSSRFMYVSSGATHTITGHAVKGTGTPTITVGGAMLTLQLVNTNST
jgi:hypothetical protein